MRLSSVYDETIDKISVSDEIVFLYMFTISINFQMIFALGIVNNLCEVHYFIWLVCEISNNNINISWFTSHRNTKITAIYLKLMFYFFILSCLRLYTMVHISLFPLCDVSY